jgi:hypothetical protein
MAGKGLARMTTDERAEDIEHWWSGGFPGSFEFADGVEARVYRAFRRVLLAMPEEHFDRFMELRPTIVCAPETHGKVFRLRAVAPPSSEVVQMWINVIYLSPNVTRWSDEALASTIAHEIGHLILGHHEMGFAPVNQGWSAQRERAADDLAHSWGFRRAYSKKQLRGLEAVNDADHR